MNNSLIISKMLVAITGLMMVGFILGHTAANIFVLLGPDLGRELINAYAAGLRDIPLFLWGARIGLIVAVLLHIVLSIKLTMLNKAANPVAYKVHYSKKANFVSKGMALFGLVILFFVVYHLLHYTFGVTNPEFMEMIDAKGRHDVYAMVVAGVNYYTGQFFDIEAITKECHKYDIIAGFDLAHAAGNVVLKLNEWQVDFAAWCSYKYLNSGPGGIAGAFVHEKHKDFKGPRFEGWWGTNKKTRFLMQPEFDASEGVESWQLSNPPIFQLATLNSSLDIFEEVGMLKLREKSINLSNYVDYLLSTLDSNKIQNITPTNLSDRGCQLSLRIKNGKEIFKRMMEQGVIADWREPDVIRIAPVPLYNSFLDIYKFYKILKNEI